ncbi:hypothetical protein J4O15_03785 [Lachnoanaerobaculum sp. Marseille-Q4761]|uniref:hypothetical protein n=1 Tax=Lachnoanaerobaculum sp. Marseille-Q4761 TaxID=2819511 RepID=UPI001AA1BF5D|nr:hypothetical protein [Lachnoanaerobaculum sp. Marseille-Q4761]MBO1870079.1 hypothetical protein [Lachnoanaerobaculum sp. Marseille-Q4761]
MIEFSIDEVDLSRIRAKLLLLENQVPNVIKRALNATARDAKTALADKARETYAVKSSRFKKAIKQKNATASNLVATLKITGKATALSDFKYRRHSGGASARGKLYKDGSLKDLSLNDKLKAFVVKYHSGHTAVVRRDPPGRYTKGISDRRRTGGDTTKLKEFYSPSIPRMIGNEAKVYGIVKPKIQESLKKHISRETNRILGGR